jgi:23S rRNA pseudoU1915 N3-methylase RlmH
MRNEKQGLHIALVIFVILTIVLSVTTFIFFRSWTEAKANVKRANEETQKANTTAASFQNDLASCREWIAGNPTADMAAVKTAFDGDMAKAAATQSLTLPQQNYTELAKALFTRLDEVDTARQAQDVALKKLNDDYKALEAKKDELLAEQRKLAADAAAELKTKTDAHTQADAAHVATVKQVQDDKKAELDKLNEDIAKLESEKKQLEDDIKQLRAANVELAKKNEDLARQSFEVADGEISWVNQGEGTVWINLGGEDGLRKRISFSVWGRDVNEIEVTQILEEHLAEARIVQDYDADPIMPGDKIFTPLWDVGRIERFGIVGKIDMDGDGRSDLAMIRELIAANGGVIDTEMDDDGKITGPGMTVSTSYLIVGEAPQDVDLNKKYGDVVKQARDLGVQTLTLKEFLNYVGWSDPNNVVKFDGKGREAFIGVGQQGPRGSAAGSNTSGLFKKRKPRGNNGSAYDKD